MKKIRVNLDDNSYNIIIGHNILDNLCERIREVTKSNKIMIITDDNLNRIYGKKIISILERENFEVNIFAFQHGEKSKNLQICQSAYEELIARKFSRSDLIIALGGGVVGDLAGFVASTYLRGIDFIQIPTSLLATVDSSVGGKVAVDLPQGKNLVGSFYQPKLVIIDCELLKTLPKDFFKDGLGEVIKYGLIYDKDLFCTLMNFKNEEELFSDIDEIIYRCCDIKRRVVEKDQFDTGERMMLNFGHTIGHAIEKINGYDQITHGIAVCIGMNLITRLSEDKGLTKRGTSDEIVKILKKYNIKSEILINDKKQIYECILIDKKNLNDSLNIILLEEVGKAFIHKTDISFFENL